MRFARKRIVDFVNNNLGMKVLCCGQYGYVCGYTVSHPVSDCRDIIIGFHNSNIGWKGEDDICGSIFLKEYESYLFAWQTVMVECKKKGIIL